MIDRQTKTGRGLNRNDRRQRKKISNENEGLLVSSYAIRDQLCRLVTFWLQLWLSDSPYTYKAAYGIEHYGKARNNSNNS